MKKTVLALPLLLVALSLTACEGVSKSSEAVFDFTPSESEEQIESKSWEIELPSDLTKYLETEDAPLFTSSTVASEKIDNNALCAVKITPDFVEGAAEQLTEDPWDEAAARVVAEESFQDYFDSRIANLSQSGLYMPNVTSEAELIEVGPVDARAWAEAVANTGNQTNYLGGRNKYQIMDRTLYVASSNACHAQYGSDLEAVVAGCGPVLTDAMITEEYGENMFKPIGLSWQNHYPNGLASGLSEEDLITAYQATGLVPATWAEAVGQVRADLEPAYVDHLMTQFEIDKAKAEANPPVALGFGEYKPMNKFDSSNPEKGTYLAEDNSHVIKVTNCAMSPYDTEKAPSFKFVSSEGTSLQWNGTVWLAMPDTNTIAEVTTPVMKDGLVAPMGSLKGWSQDSSGAWVKHG